MLLAIAFVLLWAAGAMISAQPPDEPEALLARIKAKAKQNLTRLPDYVCVQTVERTRRRSADGEFEPMDTLRLEVGLVGDRELFAWPNSTRFEEKDLTDLIHRGTIGNGNFALHARNVFLSGGPEFTFKGEESLDGKRVYRYDYDVPVRRSTYKLRVRPLEAVVAFYGSFWVDAGTLDLIRLKVEVDDIPVELGLVRASDVMEYARVEIGQSDFLLARSSELNILGVAGNASRNRTTFSRCRQFVGEASLSFNQPRVDLPPPKEGTKGLELPPGLALELSLDTEIDLRKAVVGDPVRAVLARPLKDGATVLAPRGAVVHGRLVRLDRYEQPVGHYIVGLEFHTLDFGDKQATFLATMRKAGPSSALIKQAKRLDPTFDRRRRKPFMEILVNEQQRGQGILHWKANKPVVRRGLKMVWEVEG